MTPTDKLADARSVIAHVYANGYARGHHDTVEGCYTDVLPVDLDTYFADDDSVIEAVEALADHAASLAAPPAQGDWVTVPREIVDRFPEINPSNYGHDDVCKLNSWGVELVLAAAPQPAPAPVQVCDPYLCGGARFKLAHGKHGAEFISFPPELAGQWVALVDATDNRHMKAAHPPAPAADGAGELEPLMIALESAYKHGRANAPFATEDCVRNTRAAIAALRQPVADAVERVVAALWDCDIDRDEAVRRVRAALASHQESRNA